MKRFHRLKKAEEKYTIGRPTVFATYLREVVYGSIDGIITTFAVVAGFSGAALSGEQATQLSFFVVLLFGIANLFADGISMALGNYLAVRSEQNLYESYRTKEENASHHAEKREVHTTEHILVQKGFTVSDARALTEIYRKNETFWLDFIVSNELNVQDPRSIKPFYTGLATFVAFIFFGFIPLVPFLLFGGKDTELAFYASTLAAGLALVFLGILKWRVVGTQPVKTITEIVIVGGVAAGAAYLVGTLFAI